MIFTNLFWVVPHELMRAKNFDEPFFYFHFEFYQFLVQNKITPLPLLSVNTFLKITYVFIYT